MASLIPDSHDVSLGLYYPGLLTLGPSLHLYGQLSGELSLNGQLKTSVGYTFPVSITFQRESRIHIFHSPLVTPLVIKPTHLSTAQMSLQTPKTTDMTTASVYLLFIYQRYADNAAQTLDTMWS